MLDRDRASHAILAKINRRMPYVYPDHVLTVHRSMAPEASYRDLLPKPTHPS